MTKREKIEYLANYFHWLYQSDKEIAVDKILEECTDEEVDTAYNGVKNEMHDYMAVEIVAYYWQPLYKKAFQFEKYHNFEKVCSEVR